MKSILFYAGHNRLLCLLTCFFQVAPWGMQTAVQVLLMWVFEAALRLDMRAFLLRTAVDIAA